MNKYTFEVFAPKPPLNDEERVTSTPYLYNSATLCGLLSSLSSDYVVIVLTTKDLVVDYNVVREMIAEIEANHTERATTNQEGGIVFCADYILEDDKGKRIVMIECDTSTPQPRDTYDYGPILVMSRDAFAAGLERIPATRSAGIYAMILNLYNSGYAIRRFPKASGIICDTEEHRASGVRQFDYVDPRNSEHQDEMKAVWCNFARAYGGYIEPQEVVSYSTIGKFPCEASVIIPVKNRVSTVCDAIRSALSQVAPFDFNVIVVDNHSTDGTTEAIDAIDDPRLVHIIPEATNLGIGGCWNLAVRDVRCGRFAIQLDSDDLYSGRDTVRRMVDKLTATCSVMVVGSYKIVNFKLEEIPPGVIDHREWDDADGRNNILRINGMGAPRGFSTKWLRKNEFPNVSYGEDYAVVLKATRRYRVARIYDVLYLCRRWEGNSDACLTPEKEREHNRYKDGLRCHELRVRRRMGAGYKERQLIRANAMNMTDCQEVTVESELLRLPSLIERRVLSGSPALEVQYLPARARSTNAKVDDESVKARPCFLCNRPADQPYQQVGGYLVLANPYPIALNHRTIIDAAHVRQAMTRERFEDMYEFATADYSYVVFFNGARCGASAPDHFHFQAIRRKNFKLGIFRDIGLVNFNDNLSVDNLTLIDEGIYCSETFGRLFYVLSADNSHDAGVLFERLCCLRQIDLEMINILAVGDRWGDRVNFVVVPRRAFRPRQYESGELMVSPASVEVGGCIICSRREDFERITDADVRDILSQVCYATDKELLR